MTQPTNLTGKQHYDAATTALAKLAADAYYSPSNQLAIAQLHATLAAADASDRTARAVADLVRLLTPTPKSDATTRRLPVLDAPMRYLHRLDDDGPVAQ